MPEPPSRAASRGLLLAIALVSVATLAVQVLQTRLFSVMLWHHLTYLVVTVTLLGFGSAGSLLAIFPKLSRIGGDPKVAVSVCCSLFGITLILAFSLLAHTPLDTLDIEKDREKYFYLFLHYAYLVVPFLFSGLAVAIALSEFRESVHRTYLWNLVGSGIGCFLFVALIRSLGGPSELFLFASLGGVAGLFAVWGVAGARGPRVLAALSCCLLPLGFVASVRDGLVPIVAAESKALTLFDKMFPALERSFKRQDPDYQGSDQSLRRTRWSPLCRIDTRPVPPTIGQAKKDRKDPSSGPRSQIHVFQDGDAPTVIWSKQYAKELDYDAHFYGLGYTLVDKPEVLIIGPGGGNDVQTALHRGAKAITAVDINGETLRLVREDFGDYTGHLYEQPKVTVINAEGRSFLRRDKKHYDLLQMSGTDTYAALSSGSYIFSESYLYTEEAFDDFFAHMTERGVISIIRFRFEPARETLKLVATAARALQRLGVEDPRKHFIVVNQEDKQALALARSNEAKQLGLEDVLKEPIRYSCTLMRKTPFSKEEVAKVRRALVPMNANPLVRHWLYYGAGYDTASGNEYAELLGAMVKGWKAEAEFYADYPYETEPATDDKPFFFNFYSWSDVKLFGSSSDVGYNALTGSQPIGLYILAALALQVTVATLLLVLVPLFRLRMTGGGQSRVRIIVYFACLGLAYLLVEITTMQRFVLYLGHPTYSLTIGLSSFLVFSGIGSAFAGRCRAGPKFARLAAIGVVVLLLLHATVLPWFLRATLDLAEPLRLVLAAAAIAPLAFLMGMPFPTGLSQLAARPTVAWAFGVNGAASVVASILSIILAMQVGFFWVFLVAAGLYLVAAFTVPRFARA